jgi:hypothetical protein
MNASVKKAMEAAEHGGPVLFKRIGAQPIDDDDDFHKCEACGGWFDMPDLGAVLEHEGKLPHCSADQPQ